MYNADQLITTDYPNERRPIWNGQIACMKVDSSDVARPWISNRFSFYSILLVLEGSITLEYNHQRIKLHPRDVHTYAPGLSTAWVEVSPDYQAICLIIDEGLLNHSSLMNNFIRSIYFPIVEFGRPVITLSEEQSVLFSQLLHLIHSQLIMPVYFQQESLFSLCKVVGYNLLHFQNLLVDRQHTVNRTEALFHAFLQLAYRHFTTDRSIAFYADKLHVTATYLSRVVKKASGRTVKSHLDHLLANEAARRLKADNMVLSEIAFDLHFSDQASFSKFFMRMKGVSPQQFRKGD